MIFEAIASLSAYPPSDAHPPLHPDETIRTLTRLLSSHYTDRPLFRLCTGLIPQVVWESSFGHDRAELIGHPLDAAKLGAKVPRNRAGLDTYLSILEPLFVSGQQAWFLGTKSPSGADISLFYMLNWIREISKGYGLGDLTAGGARDGIGEGMDDIFNEKRYPGVAGWFARTEKYFENLQLHETRIERGDDKKVGDIMSVLDACEQPGPVPLVPTAVPQNRELDERNGLKIGERVSVVPDDTGRDDPTLGTLVGLSTEEVVIAPDALEGRRSRVEGVRLHFPRVGFVVKPLGLDQNEKAGVRITVTARSKL